jgi:hypothetical protein
MRFVDLEPGDPRLMADVLPVLLELRPHLTPESFTHVYSEGHPQGLRYTAVYDKGKTSRPRSTVSVEPIWTSYGPVVRVHRMLMR